MQAKSKMKLCIASPSFNGGGAEKVAINLANEYTKQGLDVTLLVMQDKGPYKNQLNPNVKLHVVGLDRGYKIIRYLIRYFRQERFTHVLSVLRGTNILVGLSLLFYIKTKLVFREANELNEFKRMPSTLRFKILLRMRLAYFRANKIIANANKTKLELIEYRISPQKKIDVIHNPVLADNYLERLQSECNFKFDKSFFYFLNVGRYHYQKNQALLIEAFAKVAAKNEKARLLILGEGEEEANLSKQIEQLGLTDKALLVPFQDNPFPFYKKSNCFVLSSRWEGFGNVVVEALAAGTPVISTACGGPQDILQDGKYGVLVEKDNAEQLANAMLNIMQGEPSFSAELLEQRAAEFTVKNKAAEYLQLIKSL